MKKVLLVLVIFCLLTIPGWGQKKLIKRIFSNEKDTTRSASFMPVPVLGYTQETGFEFGVGTIYSFFMDKADTTNRSSNFFGAASYATKNMYSFKLKGDAWTSKNKFHLLGEIRFKDMPFNFYGIGNNTLQADEDKLTQRLMKFTFDVEKTFFKEAYTGISVGYENHRIKDLALGGIYHSGFGTATQDGGSVLFLGVSQSYDTRNSNNYPTKGFFGRLSYQYAPPLFGSESFTGSQIKLNLRNYWLLAPKIVLGAQALYYTIQSNATPFYLMPQLGNDEMMRGYYNGRFRDENLLATQAELRYRFMERLGVVAFAGTGKVFAKGDALLAGFKPNFGVGGRYFFDPAKGLSIRLDYGVGEKRMNEERQSGFYISFAEAF